LALVALSVLEQRYRAVMAVLDGARVTEVAAEFGVSRQSVHSWVTRYRARRTGAGFDHYGRLVRLRVTGSVDSVRAPSLLESAQHRI
jgi:transposase-like protein